MGGSTGYAWDYVFDWTIMKYQQNAAAAAARQSTAALDPAGVTRDSRRATAEELDRDRSAFARQESARRRCVTCAALCCCAVLCRFVPCRAVLCCDALFTDGTAVKETVAGQLVLGQMASNSLSSCQSLLCIQARQISQVLVWVYLHIPELFSVED